MESNYRLASLNDKKEWLDALSRFEAELKQKTGKDIVLIAYTRE